MRVCQKIDTPSFLLYNFFWCPIKPYITSALLYKEQAVRLLHGLFIYERLSFLVSADYDIGLA